MQREVKWNDEPGDVQRAQTEECNTAAWKKDKLRTKRDESDGS